MPLPQWDAIADDQALIDVFYQQLAQQYPQLLEQIADNDGLLHLDMSNLQQLAEQFCQTRQLNEAKQCFQWLNQLFCQGQNQFLNAVYVSFLEHFEYQRRNNGLTQTEFFALLPPELQQGYQLMREHTEQMVRASSASTHESMP